MFTFGLNIKECSSFVICHEHTTYFGFGCVSEEERKKYVFESLPFAIAAVGHIFSKTVVSTDIFNVQEDKTLDGSTRK